jgi:radical SAM protein with 4Fe4S-binding SPASM domain
VFASARQPDALPAEKWEQILIQAAPKLHRITLTGGEPTLHPEFHEVLDILVNLNLPFTIFTNARWESPRKLVSVLQTVDQCKGILISLHGPDAITHDRFTGVVGSFEETVANIDRAVSGGINVFTNVVLTSFNYGRLTDLASLNRQLGVKGMYVNRYVGKPLSSVEPTEPELKAGVQTVENLRVRHTDEFTIKFGNCIPQCYIANSSHGCLSGFAFCTIDPYGNVRPCNHSPLCIGNVLRSSLLELWQSDAMMNWRTLPSQCGACAQLRRCRGGCRAERLIRGADPLVRQPFSKSDELDTVDLSLPASGYPVLDCFRRLEDFGYILARGNCIQVMSFKAQPILDVCDGSISMDQIQQNFGSSAIDLIGYLYLHQLVRFEFSSSTNIDVN